MDAAYGTDSRLRTGMTGLGVTYAVGIQPKILVWPPGAGPKRRGKRLNNTGRRDEPDLICWRLICPSMPGARSDGGKVRPNGCRRALPACAFGLGIAN